MKKSSSARIQKVDMVQRRRHERHVPREPMTALLDTQATAVGFEPNVMAMVLNISHQGICIVVPFTEALQPEETCTVQIEGMPLVKAQVRWRLVIDPQVIKLGLLFFEERPVDIRRVKSKP